MQCQGEHCRPIVPAATVSRALSLLLSCVWRARLAAGLLCALASVARAQQPFYTDDADVTAKRHFHLEITNQFAVLQRDAFPNLRQNAVVFQLNYGLLDGLELGVDFPLLAIFNAPGTTDPRVPVGIGDANITIKWLLRPEKETSRLPAFTLSFATERATGNPRRQLGSGLADYGVNSIVQKTLTPRLTLRINNGFVFSGNTLTGVVGLRAQGLVYYGGLSVTHQVTSRLLLGAEINGAFTRQDELGKGQLQEQVGGKWLLREGLTLDFGVATGRFADSPRLGVQVGISQDF